LRKHVGNVNNFSSASARSIENIEQIWLRNHELEVI